MDTAPTASAIMRDMKCPHCLVEFHEGQAWWSVGIGSDKTGAWLLNRYFCPSCRQFVFYLESGESPTVSQGVQSMRMQLTTSLTMVWPKGVSRAPIPPDVPPEIVGDYKEACLVLADSPKASAALTRRCLQTILRDKLGAKKKDLNDQIDEVTATGKLPSHIDQGLHAVRTIGNFAAHPIKSTSTGTIVDVEPGEAEWNLEVVEMLFDFCFVLPAIAAKRKADLNKKLKDAGKPEIP